MSKLSALKYRIAALWVLLAALYVPCGSAHPKILMHDALRSSSPVEYLRTIKDFNGSLGIYSMGGDGGFALAAWIREVTSSGIKWKGATNRM